MIYTAHTKGASCTLDFSDIQEVLKAQHDAFVILRYSDDIPPKIYPEIMKQLACEQDNINDENLRALLKAFLKASGPIMLMEESDEYTIEIDTTSRIEFSEDADEEESGLVEPIIIKQARIMIEESDDDGDDLFSQVG